MTKELATMSQSEYARIRKISPQAVNQSLNKRLKPFVIEITNDSGRVEKRISTGILSDEELIELKKMRGYQDESTQSVNQLSKEEIAKIIDLQLTENLEKISTISNGIAEQNVQLLSMVETMSKELSMLREEVQQLQQERSSSTAAHPMEQAENAAAPAAAPSDQAHGNPDPAEPEVPQTAAAPAASAPMARTVSTSSEEKKTVRGFIRWMTGKVNEFIG